MKKPTLTCRCFCCGGCAVCWGVVLTLVGLVMPGIIMGAVQDALKNNLPLDTEEKFKDRMGGGVEEGYVTYHVINITNPVEVQSGMAKPILDMVSITLDYEYSNYDIRLSDGDNKLTYRSWGRHTVPAKYKDLWENGWVVMPNPTYLAGIPSRFGTQTVLFVGLANRVVDQALKATFLDEDGGLVYALPFLTIPAYLMGLRVQLLGSGMFTEEQVQLKWAGLYLRTATLYGLTATDLLQGFEIFTGPGMEDAWSALNADQVQYLWDDESDYSIMSGDGMRGWLKLIECYDRVEVNIDIDIDGVDIDITAEVEIECLGTNTAGHNISKALEKKGPGGNRAAMAVATWMRWITKSTQYFDVVKTVITMMIPEAEDVYSWLDYGALQFGTCALTKSFFFGNKPSLFDLGILPKEIAAAPEFCAYTSYIGALDVKLTVNQSKAFIRKYREFNVTVEFLKAIGEAKEGRLTDIINLLPVLADTGLTVGNAAIFARYMTEYLARMIFVPGVVFGGPLDEYGVYPTNTGIFTKQKIKNVFRGWVDDIVVMIDPAYEYHGILGKEFESVEDQKLNEKDPIDSTWTIYTGKDDVQNTGNLYMWKGVTQFTRRDDVPDGSCTDGFTTLVRKDEDTCFMWNGTTIVLDGHKQVSNNGPYPEDLSFENYKKVKSHSPSKTLWSAGFMRGITMDRVEGDEEIWGVRAERFELAQNFYLNDCTAPDHTEPCDASNAPWHMHEGDGIWPFATAYGGAPYFASPRFFMLRTRTRTDLSDCFDWTLQVREYRKQYLLIEPITGITIGARIGLQANAQVAKSTFDQGLEDGIFEGTGCDNIFFPMYIREVDKMLKEDQASTFLAIYRGVEMAELIKTIALPVGIICLVFSCVCCGLGVRFREKGEAPLKAGG